MGFLPFLPQGKKMRKRLAFPRSCPYNKRLNPVGGRHPPLRRNTAREEPRAGAFEVTNYKKSREN